VQETDEVIKEIWKTIHENIQGKTSILVPTQPGGGNNANNEAIPFMVTWRIAADYKAACQLYGLKGQNSTYRCPWCHAEFPNRVVTEQHTQRTIADMKHRINVASKYMREVVDAHGNSKYVMKGDTRATILQAIGDDEVR
jgi:hypothetical protein